MSVPLLPHIRRIEGQLVRTAHDGLHIDVDGEMRAGVGGRS